MVRQISVSSPEQQSRDMDSPTSSRKPLKLAILVVVVAILVAAFLLRDQLNVAWFRTLGYAGVFLMALIGSSTVLLPIPHLAFTFTMGAVLNPWLTGLSAGIGDALGEITGYMAGYAVEDMVSENKLYVRLKRYMERNGDITIFVLSLFPVPFFDLAAMAGGLVGYPLWRFMLATFFGKTIKACIAAWAGYMGVAWVADLLRIE
jgi:uncharacterized membrane protein YdjX (TVP38/TMEM64 family)